MKIEKNADRYDTTKIRTVLREDGRILSEEYFFLNGRSYPRNYILDYSYNQDGQLTMIGRQEFSKSGSPLVDYIELEVTYDSSGFPSEIRSKNIPPLLRVEIKAFRTKDTIRYIPFKENLRAPRYVDVFKVDQDNITCYLSVQPNRRPMIPSDSIKYDLIIRDSLNRIVYDAGATNKSDLMFSGTHFIYNEKGHLQEEKSFFSSKKYVNKYQEGLLVEVQKGIYTTYYEYDEKKNLRVERNFYGDETVTYLGGFTVISIEYIE